jgi:hypothetical protein
MHPGCPSFSHSFHGKSFYNTEGILVKIVALDFDLDSKQKKKGKRQKKIRPLVETCIQNYSMESTKLKVDKADPFARFTKSGAADQLVPSKFPGVKDGIVNEAEVFLACPLDCTHPLQIELVGDAKMWDGKGRLLKDVVGCGGLDISHLKEEGKGGEQHFSIDIFKPMYGARFLTEIYTRGCHWIPRMFA